MTIVTVWRTPRSLAAILLGLVLLSPMNPSPSLAARPDVSPEIQEALEKVVDARIKELKEEKNEEGLPYKKAFSSKIFRPTEDGGYLTRLSIDTVRGDEMTLNTFALHLAQDDAKEWKIEKEELVFSKENALERPALDDAQVFSFDTFSFDREGMRIKAGPGTAIITPVSSFRIMRDPKIDFPLGMYLPQIEIYSDHIEYDYAPPRETGYYERYRVVRRSLAKKLLFDADRISIIATPQIKDTFLDELFTGRRDAEIDALPAKWREIAIEKRENRKKARKKNNLSGFQFKIPDDEDAYLVRVFRKKSDHWFGIYFDRNDRKEISALLEGSFFPLYRYYSQETLQADIHPRILERRPDKGSRDYEVSEIRGTVELGLKDNETMYGNIDYTLRARRDLDEIDFGIAMIRRGPTDEITAPDLKIFAIQDAEGKDLPFFQTGKNSGKVIFPETIKAGQNFTLHMEWENARAIYDYSRSYKGMQRGGWLPFVRFADMIDVFELTIKHPAEFKTLGIGQKLSDVVEGNVRTTKWTTHHPVTFPTIIYGDYYEVESTVPATKIDGTKIPVVIHVDKQAMTDWQIRPKQLLPLANYAANSINLYRAMYDVDYPFAKLDLVNDPVGGLLYGQAPSSIIYLGSLVFRGSSTIATGLSDRANSTYISRFMKSVVAHEVGHQWWGASTANTNQGNYWFVESLAEYSSAIFLEKMFGQAEYDAQVTEWREAVLKADLISSVQEASEMISSEHPGGGYQAAVYNKGPYAFHILRSTFGDEKFFGFMRALAKTFAKKEISTEDMVRVSEIYFGEGLEESMEWFWGQWIRGVGLPEYKFQLDSRPTEDGAYLIEGKIQQRLVLGKDDEVLEDRYFRGRVPVVVEFRRGEPLTRWVLVEGPETFVRFKVAKKPKKIVLNGHGEVLTESQRRGTF